MRIIELTGVPCSGKTQFINGLKYDLKISNLYFIFYNKKELTKYLLIKIKINYFFNLIFNLIKNVNKNISVLKYSLNILKKSKNTGFVKLYIYYNILKKIIKMEYIISLKIDGEIYVDEGISHIPFNLIDYELGTTPEVDKIYNKINELLKVIDVILINALKVSIYKRLSHRGHKRLKLSIHNFIDLNASVQKKIEKVSVNYFKSTKIIDNM